MQGHKQFVDKVMLGFQLSERVPKHNLYRRLAELLDWDFLYEQTQALYSHTRQPSLDPVVFFKLRLVSRLENLVSDRHLVEHCSLRLDILYFLGYEVDEELPWHSTISRTRQRYPAAIFEHLFEHVFVQCVAAGLVTGHTQAVDSAFVKANASLESLCEKQPADAVAPTLHVAGELVTDAPGPLPSTIISSPAQQLQRLASTHARYLRHESGPLHQRLTTQGLPLREVAADTTYSNGVNYALLEAQGITPWIPVFGKYKPQMEGFTYDQEADCFTCPAGKLLPFKSFDSDPDGRLSKRYSASSRDCRRCPHKPTCVPKPTKRKITRTAYDAQYRRALARQQSRPGRRMRRLRQRTIEPVFGSLLQHYGLRRVNTRDRSSAHKTMRLTASAFKLKKLLKHQPTKTLRLAIALPVPSLKGQFLRCWRGCHRRHNRLSNGKQR